LPRSSANSTRFSVGQYLITLFADWRAVSDVGIVVHLIIREISQAVITHRLLKDLRLKFLEQFFHWIGHCLFLSLVAPVGKGIGSSNRQFAFVWLDSDAGRVTNGNFAEASNGAEDSFAGELIGMRRGVCFDLGEVGQDDGADHFVGNLTNGNDFFLPYFLSSSAMASRV
jgi:hypothetical protein